MKKKVALSLAAVAMVGTLAVGGTLAWFTDVETATNLVTMGNVDIKLSETGEGDSIAREDGITYLDIMPGDTFKKEVVIDNLGNDAYVRVKVTLSGDDVILGALLDKRADNDIVFEGLPTTGIWEKDTENNVLFQYVAFPKNNNVMDNADNSAWTVFTNVKIPSIWGNEFEKANLTIRLDAEAIQADNINSAEEAWGEIEKAGDLDAYKTNDESWNLMD